MLKKLAAAALLATLPVSANAVIITTDGPVEGAAIGLSFGDIFTIEIDGDAIDGGGMASFGFTASSGFAAIETNSLNPVSGFTDATVEWNSAADGTGTTFASLTTAEVAAGAKLITPFAGGDTKWLIAKWTDVSADKSNFDLRVEAVPLPASLALFLAALGGLGLVARRRAAVA